MSNVQHLPNYENPPVIEVAASVQFDPLPNLHVAHLGLLWQRFRVNFPKVEQKPPIPPVVERLGVRVPLNEVQFQVSNDIGMPRVWLVNESGDELIQVQSDRFIRNWRAMPQLGRPYPRYEEHIKPRFIEDYEQFQRFMLDEQLGTIEANQCELTYINHITPNEYWSSHRDLGRVFRGWGAEYPELPEQPLEAVNLLAVHVLNDDAGAFLGRLHVTIQSAFRAPQPLPGEDQPIFVLAITARGRPTGKGEAGILGFMDIARRAIVGSFDRMTTPEMHKVWGKRYDS